MQCYDIMYLNTHNGMFDCMHISHHLFLYTVPIMHANTCFEACDPMISE